tara:strand:- start:4433 stop:4774 length:342 start_codon:yes stop_codon:yes gene_type:complete
MPYVEFDIGLLVCSDDSAYSALERLPKDSLYWREGKKPLSQGAIVGKNIGGINVIYKLETFEEDGIPSLRINLPEGAVVSRDENDRVVFRYEDSAYLVFKRMIKRTESVEELI